MNHPDPIVPRRRGPRYRQSGEMVSTALADFREHTDGLSNRLPLPSLEAMRAGTVLSPHGMVRRYLMSARRIGLPKAWALKFSLFVQRTIDAAWPMESTSLHALEEKAMVLEAKDDLCEKRHALEANAITVRERIEALTEEITADMQVLARLERLMEDCQ